MGTNYYWYKNPEPCPSCGHESEGLHIGKSSAGWTFSFHGTEEVRSWEDWKKVLQSGGKIFDEYGDEKSFEEMRRVVENRSHPRGLLNHFDYCAVHHPEHNRENWKDDEGHSFSPGEFS